MRLASLQGTRDAPETLVICSSVGVALAGGFVEDDRGGSGGVEGLNAAGHGDVDAGIRTALDLLGKARAFVANEEGDGLAPVDLPGGERRGEIRIAIALRSIEVAGRGRAKVRPYIPHAGGQRADAGDF